MSSISFDVEHFDDDICPRAIQRFKTLAIKAMDAEEKARNAEESASNAEERAIAKELAEIAKELAEIAKKLAKKAMKAEESVRAPWHINRERPKIKILKNVF